MLAVGPRFSSDMSARQRRGREGGERERSACDKDPSQAKKGTPRRAFGNAQLAGGLLGALAACGGGGGCFLGLLLLRAVARARCVLGVPLLASPRTPAQHPSAEYLLPCHNHAP